MYNQSEALLEQYDLDIKQITKGSIYLRYQSGNEAVDTLPGIERTGGIFAGSFTVFAGRRG